MRGRKTRFRGPVSLALTVTMLAVLMVMVLSGGASAAPPWTDAPNSWWVATYQLTDQEIGTVADGYPDGTFRPNLDVTRGQFAKMVVDGMSLATVNPPVPRFTDVPASHYFYPWIEGGAAAGIISGFADGSYGPQKNIIRQQANSILGSYLAQKELNIRGHIAGGSANYPSLNTWYLAEGMTLIAAFADSNRLATVHAPATAYLIMRGVVQGTYSGGAVYLGPNNNLTRAQAAALIMRVKKVQFSTSVPTVDLLDPSSGPAAGGNTVVIAGTNFTDVMSVKFGGTSVGFTVNSTTQITVKAPAGTLGTTVNVTVTTPAGTSATGAAGKYTYGLPTVTSLNPASGPAVGGNNVIITGTNLTGATVVKFGTKNAISFTVDSATKITAKAPSGTAGTTVDITVTTPAGTTATSAASKYSYGSPTVTLLTPASGPAAGGTSVNIKGTGFTGVTAVKFGAKNAASYVVNSPTSITAVAPSGTAGSTVDVTVTTAAGTSAMSTASKYSYGGPVIASLNPTSGPTTGGNTVVITGTGFSGVSAVVFGSKSALTYTVNSATQITAVAPSGTGIVDVRVTTASGTSAASSVTKYTYGIPTVTALDPSSGPASGGNEVLISGTGFVGVSAVKFGSLNALTYTVLSSTLIRAYAPGGTEGTTVQVTVTASGQTSSITGTGNDYTYGVNKFSVVMQNGTTLGAVNRIAGVLLGIRVIAQDAGGNTLTGFTGPVALTSNAWVGSVNGTITANGYVNLNVTPTIAGTLRSITVTSGTVVTANASGNFTVVAGPFAKLQVLVPDETPNPGSVLGKSGTVRNQLVGEAFSVTVRAVDANWNIVPTVTDAVTIESGDPADNLPQSHNLVSGSWTFTNVIFGTAGGPYTITADDTTNVAIPNATSSAITVTAMGTFTRLLVVLPGETFDANQPDGKIGSPTAQTAGTAFDVDVYACDDGWNLVNTVTDNVSITTGDPNDTHPGNLALGAGHATFSVTLRTAGGPYTITANDVDTAGITPGTSSVAVNAGVINKLQIILPGETAAPGTTTGKTGTASACTAGQPFNFVVNAVDSCWNKVNSNETVTITSSDPNAVLPGAQALVNGTGTFNITLVTAAGCPRTITAADGPITDAVGSVQVNAGSYAGLQVLLPGETRAPGTVTGKTGAPTAQAATVAFTVNVYAVDAYWNIVEIDTNIRLRVYYNSYADPSDPTTAVESAMTDGICGASVTVNAPTGVNHAVRAVRLSDPTPRPHYWSSEFLLNP